MQDVEVYPFNPSEKLYRVTDNTGGNGWVKASCGGSEVFDYSDFYQIDNPQKEKIIDFLAQCNKLNTPIFDEFDCFPNSGGTKSREIYNYNPKYTYTIIHIPIFNNRIAASLSDNILTVSVEERPDKKPWSGGTYGAEYFWMEVSANKFCPSGVNIGNGIFVFTYWNSD